MSKSKNILKRILKILLWVMGIPILLFVLLVIVLQFPQTQHFITQKATSYLSVNIKSKVELGTIKIAFPKSIVLGDLFVQDLHNDTLLYSHSIKVDLNLWDLLSHKIILNKVSVDELTTHIHSEFPDTVFNYSFILTAFSSPVQDTLPKSKSASQPWIFSIKNVLLSNIYFTYNDTLSGTNAGIKLGSLETLFDEFDLDKKKIIVKSVALKKTSALLIQNKPLKKSVKKAEPFDYEIGIGDIDLSEINANYIDNIGTTDLKADLGTLKVKLNKLDILKERIDIKSIALSQSIIIYEDNKVKDRIIPIKEITQKSEAEPDQKPGWIITTDELEMGNNILSYSNHNELPLKNGFDYNYLSASNINMKLRNIYVSGNKINLDINQMSLHEKSGFVLQNFKTKLTYDSTHVELADLDLQTDKSRIRNYLGLKFNSLKTLKDSIGNLQTKINLDQTSIAVADILIFIPDLLKDTNLVNNKQTIINLNTTINGTIDDLRIDKFEFFTQKNTSLKLNGVVKNIRNPSKMYAALPSIEVRTTKDDINQIVSAASIPQSIAIPSYLNIKGAFTGYLKNFDAEINAKTSIGQIISSVKMNPSAGNNEQKYIAKINVKAFDFGKLVKQEKTLGVITMQANIEGHGFDTSNLYATLNASVNQAYVNGYDYKNLSIEGIINKQSFTGKASINDTNIVFNFDGVVDVDKNHPEYKFTFDLAGADLEALHLTSEHVRVRLLLASDLRGKVGENITGKSSIKNILVIKNDKKFNVDSLVFTSSFKDSISNIHLQSEILTADFNGRIVLNELPQMLTRQLNTYFNAQRDSTSTNLKTQKFTFAINLTDPTILTDNLIPGLEKLTPSNIEGSFDNEEKIASLKLNVPQIIYSGITIDSLNVQINAAAERLNYALRVAEISNPSLKFENLYLGGGIQENVLDIQFNTIKDDSFKTIETGGVIKSYQDHFELKMHPDLILNNIVWHIDSTNYLQFGKHGLLANNISISNSNQRLTINSPEKKDNSPLEIEFSAFDISTFSKIIENKTELAAGIINGKITIKQEHNLLAFTSDLTINALAFQGHPIGDVTLLADNTRSAGKYNIELGVSGNENEIKIKGTYDTGIAANNLNFLTDIKKLNLSSVEPLLFGSVTRMTGSLNGKLTITGSPKDPFVNGVISFKKCAMNPKIIDSYLKIEEGKLTLEAKKIYFNSFTLFDTLNNKAVVSGYADFQNINEIKFDLNLKTNNFLALNTTKEDNPLYYGRVYLNSDIRIRGSMDQPVISMNARLNKGSVITYATPEDEVGRSEYEGIVLFTDTLYTNKTIMTRREDKHVSSKITGIQLDAKIDFDKEAELRMLVDPISGDSVYVKGSGVLDFRLDENGNMNLLGKYRINDGGYHLSVNEFVRRDFRIERGSSISWSGDILDAYVDLSAIYSIKTSPLNLVQDELAGLDELQKNKYRTLQNFLVYLKMNGFISTPQISFDIQLPTGDKGALNGVLNSKLSELRADENQLNKQVFALLTLNRFIGQDPLENANQLGVSSASRTSASRVLTQQLSNLSAKYVKGVDLNIGVNSFDDYSSGTEAGRTQLQLGLSKQILNEKVTIQVGGNVELEGEKSKQNNASDIAGNISVEYKLTDDGRYKLKVYRETEYENPIEGEVTKTGAGIIFRRDFHTLKDLFSKPARRNKNKTTSQE